MVGGSFTPVESAAGVLTLAGSISTNAGSNRNLVLQGAGRGIVSGVIADAWDRRQLMLATSVAGTVVAFALAALAFAGVQTPWPVVLQSSRLQFDKS